MNQVYCPECQTELTKSIVGHLCHGCGSVHGFEKATDDSPIGSGNTDASSATVVPDTEPSNTSSFARHQPHIHEPDTTEVKNNKITHHVKKFVVPKLATETELPKPTSEDHMLEAKPQEAQPAEKIMPVFAPPKSPIDNEFNPDSAAASLNYPETAIKNQSNHSASSVQSYVLPALTGILAVAALIVAFLVVR